VSLDVSKLDNVRQGGRKTTARCPACAEARHDRKGEHLIINEDGHFGCVVYPGNSPDAREHRKRIFALCGNREVKPMAVHHNNLGRLGRADQNHSTDAQRKIGLLGRLGRTFQSHSEPEQNHQSKKDPTPEKLNDCEEGVLPVPNIPAVKLHRPLTEQEQAILVHAGAENDPIVLEALSLFNGRIVK
jgi:hypothetical protein